MKARTLITGMALTGALLVTASVAKANTYDPALQFSASSNLNGVWSYGWEQTLGSGFTLDTYQGVSGDTSYWSSGLTGGQPPGVYHNSEGVPVPFSTLVWPPNTGLLMHPGSLGESSVVRFTAPSSGEYIISQDFTIQDTLPQNPKNVNVLENNSPIYNAILNPAYPSGTGFNTETVNLSAGATIDFVVGTDGFPYSNDSTGLYASITSVPDGGMTFGLLGGAMLGLQAIRRKLFC